jgi:hypothetical protein
LNTTYAWGTGAQDDGISFHSSHVSTGGGSLLMRGQGLNSGGADGQNGIQLFNGSTLTTTSGAMSLDGVGGNGTGGSNNGIVLGDSGTLLTSLSGAITLTGTSGTSSGGNDRGVILWNGAGIASTGSATITLTGRSIGTAGTGNRGIELFGWGGAPAFITSAGGNIILNGLGAVGSTGDYANGVSVNNGSYISALGTAAITLNGTGGGSGGIDNNGILFDGWGIAGTGLSTVDGDLTLNGVAGAGYSSGLKIYNAGRAQVTGSGNLFVTASGSGGWEDILLSGVGSLALGSASMTGNINLNADTISIYTPATIRTQGNITVKPRTASASIGLSGGAGTLNLDANELGYFHADGLFTIGDVTSGTGAVDVQYWDFASKTHDVHIAGGSINQTNGIYAGSNNLTLTARTGNITHAGNRLNAGTLTLVTGNGSAGSSGAPVYTSAATLLLNINGGSAYLSENDSVNLSGSVSGLLDIVTGSGGSNFLGLGALNVGSLTGRTTGGNDLLLNGPITASGAGNAIVLATESTGDIHNAQGPSVFTLTGGGRWLLYSETPAADTKNGLSGYSKRYNKTYAGYGPGSVIESGNVWLYGIAPTLTITPNAQGYTYDGTAGQFLGANYGITGYIDGDSFADAISGGFAWLSASDLINAGVQDIVSGGNYASDAGYGFSYATLTNGLTISPRALTVAANSGQGKAYGAADPIYTYAITSGSLAGGDALSGTLSRAAGENVGSYALSQGTLMASANYALTYVAGSFSIIPKALTIAVNHALKTYGGSNPSFSFASFAGSLVAGDSMADVTGGSGAASDVTYTTSVTAASNAGTYADDIGITASSLDGAKASNYAITIDQGDFTVGKAMLVITADSKSKEYGDATPALTVSYSGFVGSDTASVLDTAATASTTATAGSDAGRHVITALGGWDNNYAFTYGDGALTIGKALLTVRAGDKTRRKGKANPVLDGAIDGFVLGQDSSVLDVLPAYATAADKGSPAGRYVITASGAADGNYAFAYLPGTLTVTAPMGMPLSSAAGMGNPDIATVLPDMRRPVCFQQYAARTWQHKNANGYTETRIDLQPRSLCY